MHAILFIRLYWYPNLGAKSDDIDSPAYVPSLFSCTPLARKRQAEVNYTRWKTVKKMCLAREALEQEQSRDDAPSECSPDDSAEELLSIDATVENLNTRSLSVQTDLTMRSMTALEEDNVSRQEDVNTLKQSQRTGFPTKDQLENNNKIVTFYTGLSTFTILSAVYDFVSQTIHHTNKFKLSSFNCFLLTLMKLRLNLSNFDLAFRFNVSESTGIQE